MRDITNQFTKDIVTLAINGQDYQAEVRHLVDVELMQLTLLLIKRVIDTRLKKQKVSLEWYDRIYRDIKKGKLGTGGFDAPNQDFENLYNFIESFASKEDDIDITLNFKFRGVGADFSLSESLILINTLVVGRDAMRRRVCATIENRTEKILMDTICQLYSVPEENYTRQEIKKTGETKGKKGVTKSKQDKYETAYYLSDGFKEYKCEVKLRSEGNSEDAKCEVANNTDIVIAGNLYRKTIMQFSDLGIEWVNLREENGYQRFGTVLPKLNISHTPLDGDLDARLKEILDTLLP